MADLIGGSIGDVKIIQVNFGDNISLTTEMKRLRDKALGGNMLIVYANSSLSAFSLFRLYHYAY